MIDRYLKDNEVTIHDNKKGTYSLPYQDNIDEVVELDNNIDLLEDEITAKKKERRYLKRTETYKYPLNVLKYLFLCALVEYLIISINVTLGVMLPALSVGAVLLTTKNVKEKLKREENGISLQINYLEEELEKKKYRRRLLLKEKNKSNIPEREEVILNNSIKEKREELQKVLDLLMDYQIRERYFQKHFDNHTLEDIIDNEEEKKLIQEVIIKSRRR